MTTLTFQTAPKKILNIIGKTTIRWQEGIKATGKEHRRAETGVKHQKKQQMTDICTHFQ